MRLNLSSRTSGVASSSSSSRHPDIEGRRGPPYFHPIPGGDPFPDAAVPAYPRSFFPGGSRVIGDADLDPFTASPGLVRPPGGLGAGGGMFVGPDHPMFGGAGRGGGLEDPSRGGGWGGGIPAGPGGERLPPGAVPPGARFDPIMPPGIPGPRGPAISPRGGFGGGLGRGGGLGGGPGGFR